jgi:hypothetical protein
VRQHTADAVTASTPVDALIGQRGGIAAILQTPPPTAVVTALNSAPTAPTSPVSCTKTSLATPDLTAIRKAGKESIKQLGPQARTAEFNAERDKAVGRVSQAVASTA